jgi:hypothetical protein
MKFYGPPTHLGSHLHSCCASKITSYHRRAFVTGRAVIRNHHSQWFCTGRGQIRILVSDLHDCSIRFSKFIITAHLPLRIYHELHQSTCGLQESIAGQEDTYVLNSWIMSYIYSQIMSYILNMFIYVGMILVDNLLQYFMFIIVIYLSSTLNNTVFLICKSLFTFMIYLWIKIKLKTLTFPTIQKSYFSHFSLMAGFVDALRPVPFTSMHFKRWQSRVTLWLTAMGVFWVSNRKPKVNWLLSMRSPMRKPTHAVRAVIGALAEHLQDVYLHDKTW